MSEIPKPRLLVVQDESTVAADVAIRLAQLRYEVLGILNEPGTMRQTIRRVLANVQASTGADAVAMLQIKVRMPHRTPHLQPAATS